MERVDVAVIGAGTAGSAVAAACAAQGLRVVVLEGRDLGEAGARWVNAVPSWCLAAFGEPDDAEIVGGGGAFHLVAGWGPERVVVPACAVPALDMRALVARLQAQASAAGAELRGRARVRSVHGHVVHTDRSAIDAEWIVDASGLAGLERRVGGEDLCAAAQQVHAIADRGGAERFLEGQGAAEGDGICFTGVAGGYSIVNVRIVGGEVHLLAAAVPADGEPSGVQLIQRFLGQHRWIGAQVYGGARAIPLARPPERLYRGPLVLIGDAASQVFAAHGSGIGAGLVAAGMLADALASGQGAAGYNLAWQRRWGGEIAASVLLSRASRRLGPTAMRDLMRAGALPPGVIAASLMQQGPGIADGLRSALGAARVPSAALLLGPALARGALVKALYARFPEEEAAIDAWGARARRIMAELEPLPPEAVRVPV